MHFNDRGGDPTWGPTGHSAFSNTVQARFRSYHDVTVLELIEELLANLILINDQLYAGDKTSVTGSVEDLQHLLHNVNTSSNIDNIAT